jgi:hypothetical protein
MIPLLIINQYINNQKSLRLEVSLMGMIPFLYLLPAFIYRVCRTVKQSPQQTANCNPKAIIPVVMSAKCIRLKVEMQNESTTF